MGPIDTLFLDALVHFGFVSIRTYMTETNKQTNIIHIFSLPISDGVFKQFITSCLIQCKQISMYGQIKETITTK